MDFLLNSSDIDVLDIMDEPLDIIISVRVKGCTECGTESLVITQSETHGRHGDLKSKTIPLNDIPWAKSNKKLLDGIGGP